MPPTRIDFSIPKIQSRPRFLKFYSRTGSDFKGFTLEQDPFLTIGLKRQKCQFESNNYVFLSEFNMILPLWMTFNILRSSQMNKEYKVKSEQFISLSALPFHEETQLINYLLSGGGLVFVSSTIQYNTIQYNTIQYNTIQYNTIQYNTIQYNTIQYNTIQYNTKI